MAALADGSLAPERRAALETQVAGSSELADRLAEQQRAVELVRVRRSRGRRPCEPACADRGATTCASQANATPRRPGRRRRGGSAGSRDRAERLRFRDLRPALPRCPRTDRCGARRERRATLTKTASGWKIELDATGLPRLEGGRFYQAWLRNADGVLVPIGTFNEGQDVTLWAGVSPKDFTTLTITREQADGEQASSGEKVLVGTVDTGS